MLTRYEAACTAAMVCAFLAFASLLFSGWCGPISQMLVGHAGVVGCSIFACICALTAGFHGHGQQRAAWLALAPGIAGWTLGDLVCAGYDANGHVPPPFPSLASSAHLLLPLAAGAAAFVTLGGRAGLRLLLDGAIVASSLFIVAWSLGLHALNDAGSVTLVQMFVAFAYLAMYAMLAVILVRSSRRHPAYLLMLGLISIGLVEVIRLGEDPPQHSAVVMVGGALGMILVGASALTSKPLQISPIGTSGAPTRATLWLPYLPVPFAVFLGAPAMWAQASLRVILVMGVILVSAALLRQFTLLDENQKLLATVADIALRDPLTSLPNRALFVDRLAHAMQLRLRSDTSVTVLLLDLDDFKLINDSLGHAAGDALLRDVGDRVHHALRAGDTVARLGGDEFAILIEDDPAVARDVADRVVEAFDEPFELDGREVFVRPSVGLASTSSEKGASAVRNDVRGLTGDELFRRADLAMYSAKRAGFSGVRVYDPDTRHDATRLRLAQKATSGAHDGVARFQLLGALRRAINQGNLTLLYQPKFSLATGAMIGVEALVRWPHPELGLLEPADFLPLVRRSGLMDALTDLVIRRAAQDSAAWHSAGADVPVAINLSAPSLDHEDLPERILSVLAEYGRPADSLSVEITEDILLTNIGRTRDVLDRLRRNGIRVAIDDFGSGYATMSYLRDLPVDELKLDRQFIAPILTDPRAAAIVQAVIELAHTFGLASVAEGVENKATAVRLHEYGCGFAQGHYYSKPVPAQSILTSRWEPVVVMPSAAAPPSWA